MPLFRKNHEEPKKSLRQQLAEQESGCEIRHIVDPKPINGQIYETEYWGICDTLRSATEKDRIAWIGNKDLSAVARLHRNLNREGLIIVAHPLLTDDGLDVLVGHHYASSDDALCALEKAIYGFDLSGRKAEPDENSDPEPDPDITNPSVTLELLTGGADSKTGAVRVLCDRVLFGDYDPSGTYSSIEKAVAALGEAVADPYAKGKGKKGK